MIKPEHKTAAYKITHTETGNVYRFFCERSGKLVCTTQPYREKTPEAELEKAWTNDGKHSFNLCRKCGKWVDSVMYNADVLECVDCTPWEDIPSYCPHCGGKIEKNEELCRFCGRKLMYEGSDA